MAVSVRRGVQTVRFSDPRKLNAWSLAMQAEISDALARAAADEQVDAVVLSGTGGYYCVSARLRDRRWASAAPGSQGARQPDSRQPDSQTVDNKVNSTNVASVGHLRRTLGRWPLHR